MTSRRGFFEQFARMTEDPRKARERRVEELREWAGEVFPVEWDAEQREETMRSIELKLSYLGDETLTQDNMKKYVENLVRTKEMYYAARRAEEDYVRRNPYPYEDDPEELG